MYKISELKTKVPNVVLGNRYKVILENPGNGGNVLETIFGLDNISYYCPTVSLPGVTLATIDRLIYGESRKIVHSRTSSDLSIDFLFDGEGKNREFFEKWTNLIHNKKSNFVSYYDDYISNLTIEVLDETNEPIARIKVNEAYPVSIAEMDLSYSAEDFMTIKTNWNYHTYEYTRLKK